MFKKIGFKFKKITFQEAIGACLLGSILFGILLGNSHHPDFVRLLGAGICLSLYYIWVGCSK